MKFDHTLIECHHSFGYSQKRRRKSNKSARPSSYEDISESRQSAYRVRYQVFKDLISSLLQDTSDDIQVIPDIRDAGMQRQRVDETPFCHFVILTFEVQHAEIVQSFFWLAGSIFKTLL
ncbi:hypothetical protein CEXT_643451 [Caerostris extrusa]|uniref:Uncharacterized protein n=1 Tax=Caerostris extrusa TaxID=172846 RepID=A0AAV4RNA9_CAEEX|nr:hypothetical protein CEXT_643451 [Caerostris extrusa]